MNLREIEDLIQYPTGLCSEAIEALAEYAGVGLFNMNVRTGEISLNRNICHLTGYEPGDVPHDSNSRENLTFVDDRKMVRESMEKMMRGEIDRYSIEYRMVRRDHSMVSVSETAIVYERDENGVPVRIAALATDLTRLRWAEEKARVMEQENRTLAKRRAETDLADQNRLLRAANRAAQMIIGGFHQSYEVTLRQSLQIMGESLGADRAYIWRNYVAPDGDVQCFLRSMWDNSSAIPAVPPETRVSYDTIFPRWGAILNETAFFVDKTKNMHPAFKKI
ncbi:MAG: PAS domain-containing protein, partial [Christensenellaceae bacterium]|nr:PAS domain-containing protein [Christensenellaceae bacterium]